MTSPWLIPFERRVEAGELRLLTDAESRALEAKQISREHRREMDRRLPAHHLEFLRSRPSPIPTPIQAQLAATLQQYPGESVLLAGLKGIGKTTGLVAQGMCAIKRGRSVRYVTVRGVQRYCDLGQLAIDELETCGLLLLDQVHLFQGLPEWLRVVVVELIDVRWRSRMQTIAAGTAPLRANVESQKQGVRGLEEILGADVFDRFKHRLVAVGRSLR